MIGAEGIAVSGLSAGAEGMIRVHGELWRAYSPQSVPAGAAVRVLRVDGLKLYVEPAQTAVAESK
jgi:membrane-bound serine protease (ClpP class)